MSFVQAERAAAALGADRISMLRALPGLAIGAIAGRDSVAAIVSAVRSEGFSAVLPTSVATGTEYGDPDAPLSAVTLLRDTLADEVEVLDPLRIGAPELWAALNGRFAAEIADRFGVSSPCLACHLYVHLARVPLSWALGCAPIITGERDTHDGRIKLSQTDASIDAETRVVASAGIELLTPLRHASGDEIAQLAPGWALGGSALSCVHSGNYVRADGTVDYDTRGYARYLEEFFEPAGRAVVTAWRASGLNNTAKASAPQTPDYVGIVRGILVS
ncbi:MAG: hypothetical protein HGB10_02535 [Coriobacteriia bacterium]|nr:hypothetical protein [Coriobacteriia bacterium]